MNKSKSTADNDVIVTSCDCSELSVKLKIAKLNGISELARRPSTAQQCVESTIGDTWHHDGHCIILQESSKSGEQTTT